MGRNYAEHTKEMGGDTKDPPFFFQKNPDNIVTDGKFPYPPATKISTSRSSWWWA